MFTVTKSRTTKLYGEKAAEVYKFKFHDTGQLDSVALDIYEADHNDAILRRPDYRVVEREDVSSTDVPDPIKDHVEATLNTALDDI